MIVTMVNNYFYVLWIFLENINNVKTLDCGYNMNVYLFSTTLPLYPQKQPSINQSTISTIQILYILSFIIMIMITRECDRVKLSDSQTVLYTVNLKTKQK